MIKEQNYVGIDISKLTFDVAILNQKKTYNHHKFSNDEEGFLSFFKLLDKESDVCIMEASGPYYLKLATFLQSKRVSVSVINPLVIKRFSQMRMIRTKTDKKDASMIAEYGKTEKPDLWSSDQDYVLELKQMFAYTEQLNKHRTGLLRQREAFNHNSVSSDDLNKSLNRMVIEIEKEISLIEKKMENIIKEHHGELFAKTTSIPGLGRKTAMLLIVTTGGFKKFESAKQISSYFGLSPRIFESGTSVKGRSKICKMGMSRIRAMLYICSWSAKKCNKTCKELYDRLVEKGKARKLALIAVANKLIKQAFALSRKNEFYMG